MIKAVLFDLDGTLVHTKLAGVFAIVRTILRKLNCPDVSDEIIKKLWFGPYRSATLKNDMHIDPKQFWEVYDDVHTAALTSENAVLYDDVIIIKNLRAQGLKLAIVSGARPSVAEREINMLGKENVDCVVLAQPAHGSHPKPDPHCINLCLEKLNIKPEHAVYVGNADEDILTARNAGIISIIIDRNECPIELKPTILIKSLHELPDIISRLNEEK